MRSGFVVLAIAVLVSVPAVAGTVGSNNGQVSWQSTQCTEPTVPAALAAADPETSGDRLNGLITEYNQYLPKAQAYMECINGEAEKDENATSGAIATAAQAVIDDTKNKVARLGEPLKRKD